MSPQDKAAEAQRLAEYMRGMVQTYPQMSEDEPGGYCTEVDQCMDQAIALLREYAALLQAQPVAWTSNEELRRVSQGYGGTMAKTWFPDGSGEVPLYTRPKPAEAGRVPLTEQQTIALWHASREAHRSSSAFEWFAAGVRDAERHHGILPKEK